MSQPLIVANWKSHKNQAEVLEWLQAYLLELGAMSGKVRVVIAPSYPVIPVVTQFLMDNKFPSTVIGVQDLSPFPAGAYTGAVSVQNLKGLNVRYAIVGHSERRRYFHETHQDVANKVEQALASQIQPIVCVDRDYIQAQASAISKDLLANCIVAYEPLEAIGSGQAESVEEVKAVCDEIQDAFGQVRIIYGGSVSAANVAKYLKVLTGVLVATHSLDAKKFAQLLVAAS